MKTFNQNHDHFQKRSDQKLNIVVLGYIIRGPLGGLAWHHLQYVLGLSKLGHNVTFLEDSDKYESCFNPIKCEFSANASYGLAFARQSFALLGLHQCWAYYDAHTSTWHGPKSETVQTDCLNADLLLNLSGINPMRPWYDQIDTRVFIDTDPVFTQISLLTNTKSREATASHTHHFSFGENIGKPTCSIPDDGFNWQPTRQPVVLDCWKTQPMTSNEDTKRTLFTTIMQWESYPAVEYNNRQYGLKSHSFPAYLTMPSKCSYQLQLAMGSASAPRDDLTSAGWEVVDSLKVTETINRYKHYIQNSSAEFSICKQAYASTNSGWFSERSANYLASGKPVIAQDSGYSQWLNSGVGVIKFSSPDEAIHALHEIHNNYDTHAKAAQEIAHNYFNHEFVLESLIERAFLQPNPLALAS